MDREAKVLKFPVHGTEDAKPASQQGNSMQIHSPATAVLDAPRAAEPPPPIWMQRFFLVTTVIFCLWIGMVLAVLPWLPAWTENALVSDFPTLRWFLGTGFIRGLATGLGLLDLWIGISEAVHYRERR
jgi:hypothetical protein